MKDINWNISDNKIRMKFTIPIKPSKKWCGFWKKDKSKQESKDFDNKEIPFSYRTIIHKNGLVNANFLDELRYSRFQ